jgi:predicted DCC family thiol-disulfide oxidoreductase YuxK
MPSPVLLFDGECGLCNRVVQRILKADRRGTLRFASLQGRFAREVMAHHPELSGVDSMAWVEPIGDSAGERVFIRSEAAFRIADYLGFPWRAMTVARLIPHALRDRVYDWVARRRHRWFPRVPACSIPAAQSRDLFTSRFIADA